MKKALLILFTSIVSNVFAQHPCDSLKGTVFISSRVCIIESDTLVALATGNGPFTYKWSPGGQITDTIVINPYDTADIPHSVTIKDSCGDSITIIPIKINLETPMLFACCDDSLKMGDSVLLIAEGNVNNYQWSPTVRCLNPPCDSVWAKPDVSTIYTITGTDSAGCQAQRTVTIWTGVTGLPSISENRNIKVYPNPSSTSFTIILPNKALLKVCDITGRLLFSQMENAGIVNFGKELSAGIYFLFIDEQPVGKIVKT